MAYDALTSVENIQPYLNGEVYDENTIPKATDITEWISEATSIIYSAISELYSIPVTDSDDLLILQALCNTYVIAEVNFAKARGTYLTVKKGVRTPKEKRHTEFYETLDKILDGTISLKSDDNLGCEFTIVFPKNHNYIQNEVSASVDTYT